MKRTAVGGLLLGVAALLLSACGSPSLPAAVVHLAQTGEPALQQVQGYSYADPTAGDLKDGLPLAQTMADRINSEAGVTLVSGASGHVIKGAGDSMMVLYEFQISPTYISQFDGAKGTSGMAGGMAGSGATVHQETISGVPVAIGVSSEGGHVAMFMGWYRNGVVYLAGGQDSSKQLKDFVTKWLAAATK